ncbi:trehalose-phosphatase [Catellatospora chokoriensis]|uniref:Trehalose-phosphatase n=1 Tax=Catellatospora chokoriensis TaxID=310353 RepID=A0A8J3JYK0_9ACTN|nr:trehalose-phosphatase [Catellatospora chokoriensis]GIF93482.1 trehalose-phosphatase [Catellatospora chokoriensis]
MTLGMTVDLDRDGFDPELRSALAQLARVPHLLVACDYDGTLAPIVEDPSAAAPIPEAVAALRSLATLPQTTVAVVSGRALRDLAALSRLPSEVHLVGSHGSEFDIGFVQRLASDLVELRSRLQTELERIAAEHPGVRLENKPASVAVHLRTASRAVAAAVTDAIRCGPAAWAGVHTTEGKEVVELSVLASHKGTAIDELRRQVSAGAVLFMGDDVTDENAFRQLSGKDIGVKVGAGETAASFRVHDPLQAVRILALLLDTRRHWLFGERAVPIERHSMLADGRTVALISPDARVSWLCHPRPDSAAIFADLLGGAPAGHFSVGPQRGGHPLGQRYRPGTMTVETRWSGLTVTDWLEGDSLMRRLTGNTVVRVEYAPRPEFGQVPVQLQPLTDGLLVLGTSEHLCLYSPGVEWDVVDDGGHDTARAVIDLSKMNGEALLEMRMRSHNLTAHPLSAGERLELVEQPWREWANSLELPSVEKEVVMRSALTLRGLCHFEGGGVIAAATTSLPETLGGIRNWDYRFVWLRDGAMTVKALVELGSLTEAEAFLRWVDGVVDRTGGHPERLHPLYTVDGYELGPEAVIESLPGYAGSRPVRVGNAANKQLQLDVFGPVADVLMAVADKRGKIRHEEWRVMEAMVQACSQRWHEPDHGIWEARLPPRHHVYSKVMSWMTVDRALQVLERHTTEERPEWVELRDRIAENVLHQGWHEGTKAYTVAYGFPEMDASSLWIGLSGLLADDDPRFLDTVLAVEAELRSGPVVYRYKWDDGMPGKEGGFHICTAWLIEAYLRTGRRADAEELFDQMLATAGPTGLLPEQYDPDLERGLGNHPQAYSHLGLIRCAQLLGR